MSFHIPAQLTQESDIMSHAGYQASCSCKANQGMITSSSSSSSSRQEQEHGCNRQQHSSYSIPRHRMCLPVQQILQLSAECYACR